MFSPPPTWSSGKWFKLLCKGLSVWITLCL